MIHDESKQNGFDWGGNWNIGADDRVCDRANELYFNGNVDVALDGLKKHLEAITVPPERHWRGALKPNSADWRAKYEALDILTAINVVGGIDFLHLSTTTRESLFAIEPLTYSDTPHSQMLTVRIVSLQAETMSGYVSYTPILQSALAGKDNTAFGHTHTTPRIFTAQDLDALSDTLRDKPHLLVFPTAKGSLDAILYRPPLQNSKSGSFKQIKFLTFDNI